MLDDAIVPAIQALVIVLIQHINDCLARLCLHCQHEGKGINGDCNNSLVDDDSASD